MKINQLEAGMTVYDVHRQKAGNTSMMTWGIWTIEIVTVDIDRGSVFAKWNGNPVRQYFGKAISKWRKDAPVFVGNGFFKRPETAAEKRARVYIERHKEEVKL